MARKHKDLQPWLDYFDMLRRYTDGGFLQVEPQKHEAYVTRAALLTLAPEVSSFKFQGSSDQPQTSNLKPQTYDDIFRRIRAYAAYLSQQGEDYLKAPFALHVVGEDEPHGLLCTILFTPPKHWWQRHDMLEVIDYQSEEKPTTDDTD